MKLAIIDLGSNSVRMDIVNIDEETGDYTYLERMRELVKLSEGMNMDGYLQDSSIERTVNALMEFKAVADSYACGDILAIATAAVRKAKNRDEFCERILNETGISINVINGEQEAEYDFLGAISSLDINDCIIVDTGGGSTELILVSDGEPLARTSIPVGAVNMTEQFFYSGENAETLAALSDYVSSKIDGVAWLDDVRHLPIVGLGGSVYNLACVSRGSANERDSLHAARLSRAEAKEAYENILSYSPAERLDHGIESGRIDTIVCGVMPTIELMEKIDSDALIISTSGLKEGVLKEFLENI